MQVCYKKIIDSPLFEGIDEKDMDIVMNCMNSFEKHFYKGEFIILEQDKVSNIGVIISGTVDMIKEDIWGNKTIIVRMKTGELFGETFACGNDIVSAVSFVSSSDCEVLFLSVERVLRSCGKSCEFHYKLIENMVGIIADKNKKLMEKMDIISKKNLREKIMAYLSYQSQLQNNSRFESPLGRIELAQYLCTDRSALTRELTNMKTEGIIDFKKNKFEILKEDE